ncbi:hypothetical protein GX48_02560 [Paracoccidioides brasiliensis]|nr:hypothetical protein GX48_02560 [Paracoccidioides brasiliensis]
MPRLRLPTIWNSHEIKFPVSCDDVAWEAGGPGTQAIVLTSNVHRFSSGFVTNAVYKSLSCPVCASKDDTYHHQQTSCYGTLVPCIHPALHHPTKSAHADNIQICSPSFPKVETLLGPRHGVTIPIYPSTHRLVGALASTVKLLFRTFGQQHEGYIVISPTALGRSSSLRAAGLAWSLATRIRQHPFRHTYHFFPFLGFTSIYSILPRSMFLVPGTNCTYGHSKHFFRDKYKLRFSQFPFPVIEASVQKKIKLQQARWARVRMNKTITGIFLPGKSDKAY